ncbi:MAG: hypothetical protein HY897_01065 [Deltaproteobacteria bacterium]|nr:hypothetical protein [Deltaproteobacteria bacterium]
MTALALAAILSACDGERTADTADSGAPADASDMSDLSDLSDRSDADLGDAAASDAGAFPDHAVYEDHPYKQEFHHNYTAEKDGLLSNDIRVVVVDQNWTVWAGSAAGAIYFDNGTWKDGGLPEPIVSMAALPYIVTVWAASPNAIYKKYNNGPWEKIADVQEITVISFRSDSELWVGSQEGLGLISNNKYEIKASVPSRINDIANSEFYAWVATDDGIFALDDEFATKYHLTVGEGLPSNEVRAIDIGCYGDWVWICTLSAGTPKGGVWFDVDSMPDPVIEVGADLPYDDITKIHSFSSGSFPSGGLISTKIGVAAWWSGSDDNPGWRYYHSNYWLPNDEVRDVVPAKEGLFFATAGGIGHVWSESKTLADKAAHYDALNHERHVRLGYTTGNHLPVAGDTSAWTNGDDDNDGQWTGMYLGSQAFRYAVTQDPLALEYARTAMEAMLKLESVTGAPGFFARSIVPGDLCEAKQGSGGEWHLSQDGIWCWKGDTSSDEFVGHIFGLSLYYDLVADEVEKERIAATVGRILTRIIDNGYQLVDIDGLVTEHGQFDPYFMETIGIFGDAGLNGAMILGGLRAAHHMTGDPKFLDSFRELIRKHNYDDYVRNEKEISDTAQINHDSDEMAFLAFFTLVRYEDDEKYRAIWLEGLEELRLNERPERNPEFNMIYAALTGNDGDLDKSIDTLKRIHWDLIVWGCNNSHRKDITIDKRKDRHGRIQSTEVVPYDERYVMKWNENPYNLDFDASGNSEESATYWLLPYWMGRFYGYITGPKP